MVDRIVSTSMILKPFQMRIFRSFAAGDKISTDIAHHVISV